MLIQQELNKAARISLARPIFITFKEYYPFWSLADYNVEILCDGEVIVKIYDNLNKLVENESSKIGMRNNV